VGIMGKGIALEFWNIQPSLGRRPSSTPSATATTVSRDWALKSGCLKTG
jgi:hypothetical protein